jgi:hypothetical protein
LATKCKERGEIGKRGRKEVKRMKYDSIGPGIELIKRLQISDDIGSSQVRKKSGELRKYGVPSAQIRPGI